MFLERVCYYWFELSCFRRIVLSYHLRMLLHVFMGGWHALTKIISLVFCIFVLILIYTEEEISSLETVISLLSCGALERSNNLHIESIVEPCISTNQKDILPMRDWLERKSWGNGKKYQCAGRRTSVFVCDRKKDNSFEITVIIFKAYKEY